MGQVNTLTACSCLVMKLREEAFLRLALVGYLCSVVGVCPLHGCLPGSMDVPRHADNRETSIVPIISCKKPACARLNLPVEYATFCFTKPLQPFPFPRLPCDIFSSLWHSQPWLHSRRRANARRRQSASPSDASPSRRYPVERTRPSCIPPPGVRPAHRRLLADRTTLMHENPRIRTLRSRRILRPGRGRAMRARRRLAAMEREVGTSGRTVAPWGGSERW